MALAEWIVFTAGTVAFLMSVGVGGNDAANSMGTSLGSGALSIRGAVILCAIFEFIGASLLGGNVAGHLVDNILSLDNDLSAHQIALGMISVLFGVSLWLGIATWLSLPVSTTQAAVGGLIGFGLLYVGADDIKWKFLGKTIGSWFSSPLMGLVIAFAVYSLLVRFLVRDSSPEEEGRVPTAVPIVWAVTSVIMVLVMEVSSPVLAVKPPMLAVSSVCTFVGVYFIARFVYLPALQKRLDLRLSTFKRRFYELSKPADESHGGEETDALTEKYPLSYGTEAENQHQSESETVRENSMTDFASTERNNDDEGLVGSDAELVPGEGGLFSDAVHWRKEALFLDLQIFTACLVALAHGSNDVANGIAPFTKVILMNDAGKVVSGANMPEWILILGGAGISVGVVLFGRRVMETVGRNITKLTPLRGYAAQLATALTVLFASYLQIPLSTTHTLVGSVAGVALVEGHNALNLKTMLKIAYGMVITIPFSCAVATAMYAFMRAVA